MITKGSPKEEILKRAKGCNRCGKCCIHGSGFVLPSEIPKIAGLLGMDEERLKRDFLEPAVAYNKDVFKIRPKKRPYGKCIFLEGKLCRIHEAKPLMCRVASCKDGENIEWFLLNYIVEPFDRASLREWEIRLKTHKTIKGGEIEELVPDEKLRGSLLRDYHEG